MNHTSLTRARWVGLFTATTLALTACASSSDDTSGDKAAPDGSTSNVDYTTRVMNVDAPNGEPVDGGTLRVAEYSEARVLDPTISYPTGSTGGNVLASVYDTLLRYDATTNAFVPQLAEAFESDDNTVWTLRLRKGVKFTDGSPLDAAAVVASMERYINSYGLNAPMVKGNLTSIEASDDLTVTITLATPWATFPNVLTNGLGMILAPAAYADPENFKPIGAGPFVFESYAPSEKTVVVANDDYFDGRPHLDKIEFTLPGADSAAYDGFKGDAFDVAYLRNIKLVDEAIKDGVSGMVNHAGGATNLWLNTDEGRPTADKRVRQAIALAFDPELYLQRTSGGAGKPTKLLLGDDSLWSPGVESPATDPAAAKKLVDEAKADGFDGKVTIIARSEQASQAGAVAVQAMLGAVGIEVEIDLVQNVADQTQKIYVDRAFDIATAAMSIHDEDPYGRLAGNLGTGSSTNAAGYASPEMDALLAELQSKATPAEAKDVLTRIEALFAEDVPTVITNSGAMLNVWQKNVHGIQPSGETIVLFDDAWIAS